MITFIDKKARERINEWLNNAESHFTQSGAALDIHVNEISRRLEKRSTWIPGGLELLGIAAQHRLFRTERHRVCLIVFLKPDVVTVNMTTEEIDQRWTDAIGFTPPEISLVHADDWTSREAFIHDCGQLIGTLTRGNLSAVVHLTETIEFYGNESEADRRLWVIAS